VEGAEQRPHDAYVYAIGDEAAYLQADGEEQPTPPKPVDPASILCQFCGKSWEQVPMLFQARRRTMDPNTSAIGAVWIRNECVAQLLVGCRRARGQAADDPRTRPTNPCTARSYRAGSRFQEFRWSAPATRM
jgi:hypothetical protein